MHFNSTPTFACIERPSSSFIGPATRPPCELDFLVARYDMTHVAAERSMFPAALIRDVPVIATPSNARELREAAEASGSMPSESDLLRFASAHPAVRVALASPADAAALRCVLSHTGLHTTALAWWTPILKDFSRRVSPPTPRFQRPPSTPFNAN
jgi:hypothetical protein